MFYFIEYIKSDRCQRLQLWFGFKLLSRVDSRTICCVQERFYTMLIPRTITGSLLVR